MLLAALLAKAARQESKSKISLFGVQIKSANQNKGVRDHKNCKSDDMVQNFKSVAQLRGLEFESNPNFNLVPKTYGIRPKTSAILEPMYVRELDPLHSIQEHCTVTSLSTDLTSVQRKYVGLWRPNN